MATGSGCSAIGGLRSFPLHGRLLSRLWTPARPPDGPASVSCSWQGPPVCRPRVGPPLDRDAPLRSTRSPRGRSGPGPPPPSVFRGGCPRNGRGAARPGAGRRAARGCSKGIAPTRDLGVGYAGGGAFNPAAAVIQGPLVEAMLGAAPEADARAVEILDPAEGLGKVTQAAVRIFGPTVSVGLRPSGVARPRLRRSADTAAPSGPSGRLGGARGSPGDLRGADSPVAPCGGPRNRIQSWPRGRWLTTGG